MNDTHPTERPLRVCVYCGSSPGIDPRFSVQAKALGACLAREGVELVYGGGGRGLMGEVARAASGAGGRVVGVTPDFLVDAEAVDLVGQEVVVVPDMHSRKRLMFERADAFVALPGGIGTLEELVEQMTWVQLARHAKPVLLLDVCGFWRPFLALLDHMRGSGFIPPAMDVECLVVDEADSVVPALRRALARGPVGQGRTAASVGASSTT